MRSFYVYIMSDRHRGTLYTGMTNNLEHRVGQHKSGEVRAFTAKYHVHHLVYFEETPNVIAAIAREKEIKGWTRAKKIALIESMNPRWEDLSEAWYEPAMSF
jgi:putative endonuclease